MNSSDRWLRSTLRLFGSSSLFALIFVAAPHAWMNEIHAALGLGELPATPIVGYLARSTSAFYALVGGLFWVISFDLRRYRGVVIYLGAAIIVLGAALTIIDWSEGLPLWWQLWEGPIVVGLGLALSVLGRRIEEVAKGPTRP